MSISLYRYIASNIVLLFSGIFVFLVGFLLTFQLIKITGLLFSPDISILEITTIIGQLCLTFIPIAAPVSLFLGIIFFFNKLSNDSEFVAIKSFGMSNIKILIPVLIISIPISYGSYLLAQNLIPISKKEFRLKIAELRSKSLFSELKPGKFFYSIPGVVLYAGDYTKKSLELNNVHIFINTTNEKLETNQKIIFSKSGKFYYKYLDKSEENWELYLQLNQGNIVILSNNEKDVEKIIFDRYEFPLLVNDLRETLNNKASLMVGENLSKFINLNKEEKEKRRVSAKDITKARVEMANRFSLPFMILIFSILGFSIGVGHARIRNKKVGTQTFIVLVVYYSLYFAGIGMAKKDVVSPNLAIAVSLIFLSLYTIYKFRKINWFE